MENFKDKKADDILEKLVHINRITKVVKGCLLYTSPSPRD